MNASLRIVTAALALALAAGGRFPVFADPDPPPAGGAPADPPKPPDEKPPDEKPPDEKPPDEKPPEEKPPDQPDDPEVAAKKAAKAEEERVAKLVQDFNKVMRRNNPDEQQKALTDISATKHVLVAKAILPWIELTVDERVRECAIEVAKGQRSLILAQKASSNLDKNLNNIKYARAMIAIMAAAKDKTQVDKLRNLLKGEDTSLEIQQEALTALGQIGHRAAIPDLIRMYKVFENPRIEKKQIPRRDALQQLTIEALKLITGQDFPSCKGYELWWKANEKTFQVEPKDGSSPK